MLKGLISGFIFVAVILSSWYFLGQSSPIAPAHNHQQMVNSSLSSEMASPGFTPVGLAKPLTSTTIDVSIVGFQFSPANITVTAGTTVRWTNTSTFTHTVTSDISSPGSFDSGPLGPGGSFSFTLTSANIFSYHCAIHLSMKGSVTSLAPSLAGFSPASGVPNPGGSDFDLRVDGANFITDSVLKWNGSPRATTFISSTRLIARILETDIAVAGSTANLEVSNSPSSSSQTSAYSVASACNPLLVSSVVDGSSCGGFGAAITAVGQPNPPSKTINFMPLNPGVITLTGNYSIPEGVTLNGNCQSNLPATILDGAGRTGDGLVFVPGATSISGIKVRGFTGRQLVISPGTKTFNCSAASPN